MIAAAVSYSDRLALGNDSEVHQAAAALTAVLAAFAKQAAGA